MQGLANWLRDLYFAVTGVEIGPRPEEEKVVE
jgi:hypothetical protein